MVDQRRVLRRPATVTCLLAALSVLVVACSGDGSSEAEPRRAPRQTTAAVASSTPQATEVQLCALQHEPTDPYAFAPPATITLPDGATAAIVPGTPTTAPGAVTLDGDGSLDPGRASSAASLLWGSTSQGGPFSRLDDAAPGDVITLRQTLDTGAAPRECVQRWRIVRTFEPTLRPTRDEPTLLRLVGFSADEAGGPTVQFYVDAVPASPSQ